MTREGKSEQAAVYANLLDVDAPLREELLAMKAEDLRVRAELDAEGSLGDGYHPRMEEVHRKNASQLRQIIEVHGWPGRSLAGDDGAQAAWLIVQHSIGEAPFQRRCLKLLEQTVSEGEAPAWQPAYLLDRIRMFEGRPQVFGTQYVPDDNGFPIPWTIEDPDHVDERRRSVGLDSLAENNRRMAGPQLVPREQLEAWRKQFADWARSVGWRE
jgi:hypothetical protein